MIIRRKSAAKRFTSSSRRRKERAAVSNPEFSTLPKPTDASTAFRRMRRAIHRNASPKNRKKSSTRWFATVSLNKRDSNNSYQWSVVGGRRLVFTDHRPLITVH